jgi:hypothetical protein
MTTKRAQRLRAADDEHVGLISPDELQCQADGVRADAHAIDGVITGPRTPSSRARRPASA